MRCYTLDLFDDEDFFVQRDHDLQLMVEFISSLDSFSVNQDDLSFDILVTPSVKGSLFQLTFFDKPTQFPLSDVQFNSFSDLADYLLDHFVQLSSIKPFTFKDKVTFAKTFADSFPKKTTSLLPRDYSR